MEQLIGVAFILFELVVAFLVPVFAIGTHFGLVWGVIAFFVPVLTLLDSGCLKFLVNIAWLIFAGIACVATIGWWTIVVVFAWILGLVAYLVIMS